MKSVNYMTDRELEDEAKYVESKLAVNPSAKDYLAAIKAEQQRRQDAMADAMCDAMGFGEIRQSEQREPTIYGIPDEFGGL